jgi:hypothetical protein
MPEREVHCSFSNAGTRNEVRTRVLDKFLEEEPGTGKRDLTSKYVYYVEDLGDGSRIFLKRPAHLNKGFDFTIHVKDIDFNRGMSNRRRTNPKHNDIITDLQLKKEEGNTLEYIKMIKMLEDVYNCKEIEKNTQLPRFKTGYSAELIIKVVKWFFIEQDITYWNYSGRHMFWSALEELSNAR